MSDLFSDEKEAIEQRRWIAAWESQSEDTSPDIESRKLAAAWRTPAWRKLQMAVEMSEAAFRLTLAGLRQRYPGADEQEIRFLFASLLFDRETAQYLCKTEAQENTGNAT